MKVKTFEEWEQLSLEEQMDPELETSDTGDEDDC